MARHTVEPYCAEDRSVGSTGEDEVRLPMACSSLILTFGGNAAGYDVSFNNEDTYGPGTDSLRKKHFEPNQAVTITNFKVRSIKVCSGNGAKWGYLGFVSPRTGLAISVES